MNRHTKNFLITILSLAVVAAAFCGSSLAILHVLDVYFPYTAPAYETTYEVADDQIHIKAIEEARAIQVKSETPSMPVKKTADNITEAKVELPVNDSTDIVESVEVADAKGLIDPAVYRDDPEFEAIMYDLSFEYGSKYKIFLDDNTITDDTNYNDFKDSMALDYGTFEYSNPYYEQFIVFDETCTSDDKAYFEWVMTLIPTNVMDQIIEDGWTFYLVDQIDYSFAEYWDTEGMTCYKEKTVYVETTCDMRHTLLHEIGHIIAETLGGRQVAVEHGVYDCTSDEILQTYNHFADGSLYVYWNYAEALADFFAEYILYPRELQSSSPVLYDIYTESINNI